MRAADVTVLMLSLFFLSEVETSLHAFETAFEKLK